MDSTTSAEAAISSSAVVTLAVYLSVTDLAEKKPLPPHSSRTSVGPWEQAVFEHERLVQLTIIAKGNSEASV